MARRKKTTPKKRTTGLVLLLIVGLVVLGFLKPEWGGAINDLLGADIFPAERVAAPAPTSAEAIDPSALPNTPSSFATAKRLLYDEVYAGRPATFYCGCAYDAERNVDLASCGLQRLSSIARARRIEAEHVFPAYHFGQHRPCWREPLCTDRDGEPFKGRDCCEKIDEVFQRAHNDLHNLVPAVGEVNGDRGNYNWGMVEGEPREYGACNFEIDRDIRRAEPPDHVMGDIARIYFYMSDTYGIRLSDQDRQLFTAWDRLDPVDDWERERNERIAAIQGNRNPYVR